MNIPNYKWSAFAAASLHGALFLLAPNTPPVVITPPTIEIPFPPVQPVPEPAIVDPADNPSDAHDPKSSGGPAVAELPEDPFPPKIENGLTQKPQPYERPAIKPISETLVNFHGESGDGTGTGGPRIEGGPISITQLDRIPRATVQPSPRYPDSLKKDGVTGSVTVEFYVDASGRVYRAEARHYTHVSFVDPAVRAVLQWRFEPGRRNGRPVPFRMAVPVQFGMGES